MLHVNMEITDKRLLEFQEAYREDFGEEISPEEARAMLQRLVTLYELLAQPLTEDNPKGEATQDAGK